ncbi:MerR family transcriptional regulator [Ruminococcus sp. OA3]|uniref:MerR family transcriptional regulator n=1 Tax=Ruminococcus sp. OA3 TaxID=2914164 RepID=UPI001F064C8F|nr:MerR family transcriptional regulator [Ruminococcus sp. OA3]MCH1982620.1 MerR family transcriptional regulator [Ruminococcus sp. OA3]
MRTYKTAEVAHIIGIHPNTVRLYEDLKLIPKPERMENGYRIFTELHIEQLKLVRLAFQIEVLQNGLRRKVVEMVKVSATGDFDAAIEIAQEYLKRLRQEQVNAEEAIKIVTQILSGAVQESQRVFKRKEVSDYLNISMDALRNWEMNGLLTVRRKQNGYRIYTEDDVKRLKIIRSLRCANYSLEAILRMLNQMSKNQNVDIKRVLDTPQEDTDIIAVCDKLITSLREADYNAQKVICKLQSMKNRFL